MDTSREEKKKTSHGKWSTRSYRGREEGGGLDGDGSTTSGKRRRGRPRRRWLDNIGEHIKNIKMIVEMVSKGEKERWELSTHKNCVEGNQHVPLLRLKRKLHMYLSYILPRRSASSWVIIWSTPSATKVTHSARSAFCRKFHTPVPPDGTRVTSTFESMGRATLKEVTYWNLYYIMYAGHCLMTTKC